MKCLGISLVMKIQLPGFFLYTISMSEEDFLSLELSIRVETKSEQYISST